MSLPAFLTSRYGGGFASREQIDRHQERAFTHFRKRIMPRSPFYRDLADMPLDQLPRMSKTRLMEEFSAINTCKIERGKAFEIALRCEQSRDFSPLIGDVAVGLSTGTSGQRGLFLASVRERRLWAAIMLGRYWPELWRRQRVAFFMRADNALYRSLSNPLVRFEFFDLLNSFDGYVARLQTLDPTILIAPARILAELAGMQDRGKLTLGPHRIISVAEMLSEDDRTIIHKAFGRPVDQVYQATEGVLAMTCHAGNLHLNERWMRIDEDVIDTVTGAFCPIIHDFTRESLPILNYRLDDVLVPDPRPCPCGCASRRIARIEGREDDMLWWQGVKGKTLVPAEAIRTAIACLPCRTRDYRVIQRDDQLEIWLDGADIGAEALLADQIAGIGHRLNCRPPRLVFRQGLPALSEKKRRRIIVMTQPVQHMSD